MPLYEYICLKCQEKFEVLRGIDIQEEVKCPKCDAPARKLVSAFAVRSAGAGSCKPTSSGGGWAI